MTLGHFLRFASEDKHFWSVQAYWKQIRFLHIYVIPEYFGFVIFIPIVVLQLGERCWFYSSVNLEVLVFYC